MLSLSLDLVDPEAGGGHRTHNMASVVAYNGGFHFKMSCFFSIFLSSSHTLLQRGVYVAVMD